MAQETLPVIKDYVLNAYDEGDASAKKLLGRIFGEDIFKRQITDRVKTFDDAAAIVGITDNQKILLDYNGVDKEMLAAQAFLKLSIIRKALNEGWEPDWDNSSEYKYYPWFDLNKVKTAGSGFAFYDVGYVYTDSHVGSRLVFKSEKLAKYAATQFQDIYRQMFVL